MTNDIEAKTKVTLDYTSELPAGVTVTSIDYEVTPPVDQMLLVSNTLLASNVSTFMVSGGGVGQTYSVEATANLSDGQIWVDHILVTVTDCNAGIGPGLLFTYGPIAIANTLYYNAGASQTVFDLSTPDEFSRVGKLADSNVLVYVNGLRKEPVDDYTVNVRNNTITFMSALTAGAEVTFDLVAPPPPPPIYPGPVLLTGGLIATSLYYLASSSQTVFPLYVADRFNHVGNISTATGNALVYVNGARKEPVDDYTISVGANTITFTNPVPAYAEVDFDLVTSPPPVPVIPPPVVLTNAAIAFSLYYNAISGQTVFSLGTPDVLGHVATLTASGGLVSRNGARLVPGDSFTFDVPNNRIVLAYPAGAGESVIIDLVTPPPPPPTITGTVPITENLTIATLNTIPALAYAPDGGMLMLFVNGTAFFSPTSFTVSGNTLTWVSTLFSIPVGAAVTAVYTHV